jgi:hypothetical protein
MSASSCTCKESHTKIEDSVDPNIFECAVKDQCSVPMACPSQNFACLSDFATGDARWVASVLIDYAHVIYSGCNFFVKLSQP